MKEIECVELLGVKISNLTGEELNNKILDSIKHGQLRQLVLNVNIHAMNIAFEQAWFKKVLNNAYINFCDGDGVRLGAKLKGKFIKEKITYNRWIWDFSLFCEQNQLSYYLIGSRQQTVEKSVKVLKEKYPDLKIKGYHNGFFEGQDDINKCIEDINQKKPNVLLLGMGMPYQEKWLLENKDKCHFNIALTGGAVLEYIAGDAVMTPDIFYKLKLEWFFRFIKEPKRLFKRYFIGNPLFLIRLLKIKDF